MRTTVYPISKKITLFYLLGYLMFVTLGYWVILYEDVSFLERLLGGYLALAFFGSGVVIIGYQLINKQKGLSKIG